MDDVLFSEENLIKWSKAFSKTTDDLIKERSINNPSGKTHHIDVVMDVLNIVPIRFLADEIVRWSLSPLLVSLSLRLTCFVARPAVEDRSEPGRCVP